MANTEALVLARELGKLGGIGARIVARFLPNISYEKNFLVNISAQDAERRVGEFLKQFGRPIKEFPSAPELGKFSAVIGSGHLNLNPTIVHVRISNMDAAASVFVEAIAKEGKIQQQSAQKAVEIIECFLRESA